MESERLTRNCLCRNFFLNSTTNFFVLSSRALSSGPWGRLHDLQLTANQSSGQPAVHPAVLRTSDLSLQGENEFPTYSESFLFPCARTGDPRLPEGSHCRPNFMVSERDTSNQRELSNTGLCSDLRQIYIFSLLHDRPWVTAVRNHCRCSDSPLEIANSVQRSSKLTSAWWITIEQTNARVVYR